MLKSTNWADFSDRCQFHWKLSYLTDIGKDNFGFGIPYITLCMNIVQLWIYIYIYIYMYMMAAQWIREQKFIVTTNLELERNMEK